MTTGERIKKLRGKITQDKLASSLNVSRTTVIDWEKDKYEPQGENLKKLANFFHTTTAHILGEIDDNSTFGDMQRTMPENRSKTRIMFDELMMKMAAANPDLIIHFRDLQNNIDRLTPGDIQALADGYAYLTNQTNEEIEKRLKKNSRHGDI